MGCGYYFWGVVGRVDFFLVLLLRVCKSSSLGVATTTISPPRLIVVVDSSLRLLGGRIVLATTKPEKRGYRCKVSRGHFGLRLLLWGVVGRVDFFLVLLLRVCKSSTPGSSDTTISTPRLIVVELRAIVLLYGRNVLATTKPAKRG